MKLDLDALERLPPAYFAVCTKPDDLAALVRIARAAVAWRASTPQCVDEPYEGERPLLDALREAGL